MFKEFKVKGQFVFYPQDVYRRYGDVAEDGADGGTHYADFLCAHQQIVRHELHSASECQGEEWDAHFSRRLED